MIFYSVGLVCLLLMMYFYLKYNTLHFIASGFYIYSFILLYISALYLDINNVYSPELGKYIGGGTYSAGMLLVYLLLFFIASKLIFTKVRLNRIEILLQKNTNVKYDIFGLDFFTMISVVLLLFLFTVFIHMLTTPIPIFSGLDRETYFRSYGGILLSIMIKLINIIGLLLGVLFVYSKGGNGNRRLALLNFFFILIILFMIGNKFSTPLRFILFFILPIAILHTNSFTLKSIKMKYLLLSIFGIVSFFSMTLIYIHMYFGDRLLFEYLKDRILIAQAQLWWDFYHHYFYFNWSITDLEHAFNNTFITPLYDFKGNKFLLYLMDQIVEPTQLFNRMENGYLYTGAYPAFLIVWLSPFGSLIAHFILALVYSYLLYLFFIFMAKRYFFTTIMLGYLIISIIFIFVTSDFGHLYVYCLKILLILIAYMIDELLRREKTI